MKIGIDARMYGPKQGGLGRYVQQLILHLEDIALDDQFIIFLRKDNWNEYIPKKPNFQKILADIPWYGWQEQLLLTKIFKKHTLDLLHFPHWNVPLQYRRPFVVTVHDLLLLHYPTHEASTLGTLSYQFKNLAYRLTLHHATKQARHILTVSNFTKNDLEQTLKLPKNKITVTYLAPFLTPPPTTFPLDSTDILKKYRLTKPYILYVGVAYPHKNLLKLLGAWKKYCELYSPPHQLVLVGKKNFFYEKLLNNPFTKSVPQITYTNFIPDEELGTIYSNATLYIMPSLYEGSALPSLEALANHVPVISSQKTCLPEILQGAARYFDPEDTSEIVKAIHEGINNEEFREMSIEIGQKVCSSYSWKTTASITLEIYKKNQK